jgi:hypothetical protein
MRKRVSRRRWKARIRLGAWVPLEAIYNHRLLSLVDAALLDFNLGCVRLTSDNRPSRTPEHFQPIALRAVDRAGAFCREAS